LLGLASCEYDVVSTKVVRGRISAIDRHESRYDHWYEIFVQCPRDIVSIDLPTNEDLNNYHVGDSITLVVQQVKVKK
jgi:hypothetical protein